MSNLKVNKLTEYQNAEGIERICLSAVCETSILNGMASTKQFGSIVLALGTSMKDAEKAFPVGADLKGVKFGACDDEGFHRIIAS